MSVLRKNFARSVVLKQLPPSLEAKQLLSRLPSGRIHEVSPKTNDTLAINFLDSYSATHFTRKFLSRPQTEPLKDVAISYGKTHALPVEVLAAIGLKNASRGVRISSNDGKDLPIGLEEGMKKFGAIESFQASGKSAAAYFMSIESAIKALEFLRGDKTYAEYIVHFTLDPKTNVALQSLQNSQTGLVFEGLPKGTTTREFLRRIQTGLPKHQEAIRSVTFNESTGTAFINFFEPALAKIVFGAFDKAETSTGGISVSWSRSLADPIRPGLAMALGAGISRILAISGLQNVQQLRRMLKVCEEFGTVVNHPYNSSKKTVQIEFADIFSPLKAIERIQKDMSKYPAFAGTSISFATSTSRVRPMKVIGSTGPTSQSQLAPEISQPEEAKSEGSSSQTTVPETPAQSKAEVAAP